jgi:site-specific DNA-cytosine methylase
LENVKMKKEWQDIISRELWVEPIEINSSLVSAQNRKRLYRTNIPNVSQPKDKGIILKDILQENVDEKYYYSAERWNRILSGKYDIVKRLEDANKKCNTLTTVWWGNHEKKIAEDLVFTRGGKVLVRQATKQWFIVANDGDWISLAYPNSTTRRGRVIHQKSNTLTTEWESHVILIPQAVRVRKYDVDIEWLKSELREHKSLSNKEIAERLDIPKTTVDHWFRIDNCFAIPDAEIRFRLKELLWITTDRFDKSITEFEVKPWTYEKAERKILPSWKMTTLTTSQNDDIVDYPRIRKLTPIEYERLQTLPDNYTESVSDSQRYKMLWNWWTVDVIAHIFSFIPLESHLP